MSSICCVKTADEVDAKVKEHEHQHDLKYIIRKTTKDYANYSSAQQQSSLPENGKQSIYCYYYTLHVRRHKTTILRSSLFTTIQKFIFAQQRCPRKVFIKGVIHYN